MLSIRLAHSALGGSTSASSLSTVLEPIANNAAIGRRNAFRPLP
jgi:hypothetical protein